MEDRDEVVELARPRAGASAARRDQAGFESGEAIMGVTDVSRIWVGSNKGVRGGEGGGVEKGVEN